MKKSVIVNAKILQRASNAYEVVLGDVFIVDNLIEKICPKGEIVDYSNYEKIDANFNLVMPGLINLHTHLYMTTMRNYADDLPFDEWLFNKILPLEDRISKEFAYVGSQLGIMECISTGTTCALDMHAFNYSSAKSANEMGFRAFVGRGLVGEDLYLDGYSRLKESLDELIEFGNSLVKGVITPHAIYSCSTKLYEQATLEAEKLGFLKQTHLSESDNEVKNCFDKYGVSPVELLSKTGFLDQKATLAHCVKISDKDIDVIKKSGATIVSNPASNLKLGNGVCPAIDVIKNGVNITLGTDGAASNNTQNLFREMGVFNLIHHLNPEKTATINASKILDMTTINCAKALNMQGSLGEIKAGGLADLCIVDLNAINLFPNNDIVSSLVNSSSGYEVISVMIDGKWVYKNKEFLTVDKEKVYFETKRLCEKFL